MDRSSRPKRGSRDRSVSPPSESRLRRSKSTGFLKTLHRTVSIKNIRSGFGRADDSEHPSLRTGTPTSANPAFQPDKPARKKGRFLSKRSMEGAPPVPPLPPDQDDELMEFDTNLEVMDGIVDPGILYSGGSEASSPSSGMYSSVSYSHSGSSQPHPIFNNPFVHGNHPNPLLRWTRSSEAIMPTDSSDYHIPPSWLVATKTGQHLEEESSSDDVEGTGCNVLPGWKIRIYGPDNHVHILTVSTNETVSDLTPRLKRLKLPAGEERERHELYLKERGRERILRQKERPANILRHRLLQAGYEETDEYDLLSGAGMAGIPFLLKFVYRSQYLGTTDQELSFDDFEYINLAGRGLSTIPVSLHQHAESIVSLRLSRNPMIDIPLDFIQSCTALSKLYLSHMSLKKVPPSIRDGVALTLLDLSSNRLASLDDAYFEALPRLSTLHIQNNRLDRLPRTFPQLHRLTELNISNNKFTTFPAGVTELSNLSHLDISFNPLSELPREIGRLTNLEHLVIVGNQISALPPEFSNLVLLRELDCRRNHIVDLSVACVLPELMTLTADHNSLHSHTLFLGASLATLDVSHNDITELTIGRGGGNSMCLFALTTLDISNAKLSVLDDETLAQLVSLRTLKLDHNSFHTLPESLGDLKWLETLSCADNALAELPQSIGNLQKLEFLDVHSNSLTSLPVSLWNCASLSRLNATSNLLVLWHDPPPFVPDQNELSSFGNSLQSPAFPPRRPSVATMPEIPPLAHSLEMLYLGENALTDEMLHPLMVLKELRVLNLSFNDIQEMPVHFFQHLTNLEDVFLSGNRLTHIPGEDLPTLSRLSTLFVNGNRLQNLPHELGRVKSLAHLDVGNNLLNYNINNVDYDWNWNFNKNLMYLNLSSNKQLQIKSDISSHGQRPSTSSISRRSLSSFSGLSKLRVLGLMDVTITTTSTSTNSDIPDEGDDRRVRSSSSLVNGMSYGIADTLGRNHHPLMMDLVHEFRGIKKDTVFAMFGRSMPAAETVSCNGLPRFLKDNFIRVFIKHLSLLDPQRAEGVPDALRRAFLKLNQEFHDVLFGAVRKMSTASGNNGPVSADASSLLHNGASGIVVYIVEKKMYLANVGNALAIVSRGGTAHAVSRKHEPYDDAETARIRAAEGWISPSGLVNDELDISRSFGFYHLLPSIIARPDICEYDLTDRDDMIVIANRGLWDYVDYQTAVDIVQQMEPTAAAQKLRDLAISYGAEGSTMVMVVRLANLTQVDPRRKPFTRPVGVIDRTLDRLKGEVPPPVGHVAIVFTDIKGSTHFWEATPSGMITAIHLHNSLLRRCLRICGGYECKTEGDSFFCVFPTVFAAVWWCLTIQVALLEVAWPQDILECADGKEIYDEQGRLIYGGLSVRIGIHCGAPLCLTDPVTNRMDYFGLMVTRAARIASVAAGGQIVCSSDVLNEINAQLFGGEPTEYSDSQPKEAVDVVRQFSPLVVLKGEVKLKGLEVPETLSCVFPEALSGRNEHKDTVSVDPDMAVNPPTRPRATQLNISQLRELAAVCIRLEMTAADRVLRPNPEGIAGFEGDPDVLLPPNVEMADSQLTTILDSLVVRVENVENVLRSRSKAQRSLGTKNALVSALRDLDEQTLQEVWSMLHNA